MFFLQAAVSDSTAVANAMASKSIFDIILNSGPLGVTIISIQVLLSVVALYIFIERWLTIKAVVKEDERVMQILGQILQVVTWLPSREFVPVVIPHLQEWWKKVFSVWEDQCLKLKVL